MTDEGSRAGHWKHEWVPLDPVAAGEKFHGHVPAGWSPPGGGGGIRHGTTSYDTDAIAAAISAKGIDARYRSSAAIHHVTGIGSGAAGKYGPMVNLHNDLKAGRLDPGKTARFHAEHSSDQAVLGQADRAEAIAQVLDKTSHSDADVRQWMPEHPAQVATAAAGLHAYARAAREAVAAKHGGKLPDITPAEAPSVPEARKPEAPAKPEARGNTPERIAAEKANAQGQDLMNAREKARRIYLRESTGLDSQKIYKIPVVPGALDKVYGARDAAMSGDFAKADALLAKAEETAGSAPGSMRRREVTEVRKYRAMLAKAAAGAKPGMLPALAKVSGGPAGMEAVDQAGNRYRVSLKDGTVTVSSGGKTLSAPAGASPDRAARELAGKLSGGKPAARGGHDAYVEATREIARAAGMRMDR